MRRAPSHGITSDMSKFYIDVPYSLFHAISSSNAILFIKIRCLGDRAVNCAPHQPYIRWWGRGNRNRVRMAVHGHLTAYSGFNAETLYNVNIFIKSNYSVHLLNQPFTKNNCTVIYDGILVISLVTIKYILKH